MSASVAPLSMPPQAVVIQMAMGALVCKVVSEASRLNIPDLLKRYGPMSASELVAKGVNADASALERVLRACAGAGVFTEDADGRFGPNELSEPLTSDSPVSVKKTVELFGGMIGKTVTELGASVRTGGPAFSSVYGAEFWDYLHANPRELEEFGEAMKSNSLNSLRGVLEWCDLAGVDRVADVGGGFGHLAVALLEKYPGLQATVMDRPEVVHIARQHLQISDATVDSRLDYFGGDMFDSVPEAEVYIMKHIIHDWDDARCIRLLENCRRGLRPGGRVVCVDAVLPPLGDAGNMPAKLLDIVMLTHIPGKERTERQWLSLYRAAGLTIQNITPIQDNFGTSIIEGVPI